MQNNYFKSEKVIFDGESGYMVYQYHNGEKVIEQFITSENFSTFCKAVGIKEIKIE